MSVIFQSRLQQNVTLNFSGWERWPTLFAPATSVRHFALRQAVSGTRERSAMPFPGLRRTAADYDILQSAAAHFDNDCSRV